MESSNGNPASLAMLAAAAAAAGPPPQPGFGPSKRVRKSVPVPATGSDPSLDPQLGDVAVPSRSLPLSRPHDLSIESYLHGTPQGRSSYGGTPSTSAALGRDYVTETPQTGTPTLKRVRKEEYGSYDIEHDDDDKVMIIQPNTISVAVPWHKHFHGKDLPNNPDGDTRDRYHNAIKSLPWTKLECKALHNEVVRLNRARIQEETRQFHLTAEQEEAAIVRIEGINWEQIRQAGELNRRTAADCKMRWLSHDHPSIVKTKWQKDELQRLYQIVEANNNKDWAKIARELNTGRTAADCVKTYRTRATKKVPWTPEEDEKLRQAIRIFGENWQSIARAVGRHSNQCINRWTKTIRPHRKGKWTVEEDEELRLAVIACGPVWSRVAARVEGRSDAQCRERYSNVLDPNINRTEWTPEEDAIIIEQYALIGGQWGKIVQALRDRLPENGVRTDNKVMRRWDDLEKVAQGKPMPKPRKRAFRNNQPRPVPVRAPRRTTRKRKGKDADTDEEPEPELTDEEEAEAEVEVQGQTDEDDEAQARAKKPRKARKSAVGPLAANAAAPTSIDVAVDTTTSVDGAEPAAEAETAMDNVNGDGGDEAVPVGKLTATDAPGEAVTQPRVPKRPLLDIDEDIYETPPEVARTPTVTRSGRRTKVRVL